MSAAMRPEGSDPLETPVAFNYAQWVETCVEAFAEQHEKGRNEAETTSDTVLFLDAPVGNVAARVDRARRAGVQRIVSSFLPDEVDWPGPGVDRALKFFLERMEFTPLVLPWKADDTRIADRSMLYVTDSSEGVAGLEVGFLAEAWSAAMKWPLVRVETKSAGLTGLCNSLASASVIVNDVADWNLCFAIDLWAACCGRTCVRFHQPGYSPLRYALLGLPLAHESPAEIPRLRSLLPMNIPAGARKSGDEMEWFSGNVTTARWRELFSPALFRSFWMDTELKPFVRKPRQRTGARWLERPIAWAGLAAAQNERLFPAQAAVRATSTMTNWLVEDRRCMRSSRLRATALARWVREHAAWLEQFSQVSGNVPDTKAAVRRWADKAIELPNVKLPATPIVHAARAVWLTGENPSSAGDLAFAWAERLADVATRATGRVLSAAGRAVCAEGFGKRLEAWAVGRPPTDEETRVLRELVEGEEPWSISFGELAPVFRLLAALRCRRHRVATRAWRKALDLIGVAASHRSASGFLLRWAVRSRPEQRMTWLRHEVVAGDAEGRVVRVLLRWHQARADGLWRHTVDSRVRRELQHSIALLETRPVAQQRSAIRALQLATFYALDGRPDEAFATLVEVQKHGTRLGATPGVVALALWCRGRRDRARQTLSVFPFAEADAPWDLYVRAVAHQLLGDLAEAAPVLERLARQDPRYLADPVANDARWGWAAIMFKQAGKIEEATRMHARAVNAGFALEGLMKDTDVGRGMLAPDWAPLLR